MARQDAKRFEEVVLPYLDEAYTLARYLVRDEHDAQDVVQEATLRALRGFDGFRDGDARAWLLTIVRPCCYIGFKKSRADRAAVSITDDLAVDIPNSRPVEGRFTQSPVIDTDQRFGAALVKPGTYHYFCSLHPQMQGKIIVE